MDTRSILEIAGAFAVAIVAISAFMGVHWLFISRRSADLRCWAAENCLEILSSDKKFMLGAGPFKWSTNSRNQLVFFVRVRDSSGRERSGWVRCGSYLGLGKNIEVKWDNA